MSEHAQHRVGWWHRTWRYLSVERYSPLDIVAIIIVAEIIRGALR